MLQSDIFAEFLLQMGKKLEEVEASTAFSSFIVSYGTKII